MRNVFGWSVVAVFLLAGVATAQVQPGRQPVRPGQPAQPGTVQPGTVQPGTVQPGTVQPGTVQPGTVQPGTVQPGTLQPGANQPGTVRPGLQPGATNQASQQSDQQLAAIIAQCNLNEVELAKFAIDKLKSNEAKEIATAMIKDHSAAADTFGRLAGSYSGTIRSETIRGEANPRRESDGRREERPADRQRNRDQGDRNRDSERSDARDAARAPAIAATAPNDPATRTVAQADPAGPRATNQNTAGQQPAAQFPQGQLNQGQPRVALKPTMGGGLDWVALHEEIGNECVSRTKKDLTKYQGHEFDQAFLGYAYGSHVNAASALSVFRRHASSQLAAEIDGALQTTEEHLKRIRDVMEEKQPQSDK